MLECCRCASYHKFPRPRRRPASGGTIHGWQACSLYCGSGGAAAAAGWRQTQKRDDGSSTLFLLVSVVNRNHQVTGADSVMQAFGLEFVYFGALRHCWMHGGPQSTPDHHAFPVFVSPDTNCADLTFCWWCSSAMGRYGRAAMPCMAMQNTGT